MEFTLNNTLLKSECLVNGQWVLSNSKRLIYVYNPFDHSMIGTVPSLETTQIKKTIGCASLAFNEFKNSTAQYKYDLLKSWSRIIHATSEDLAKIIVLESGKPISQARREVAYAISYIDFYAEEALRIYGDTIPSPFTNTRVFIQKQPIGVVGIITPWNFPIAMMVRKIATAIACGCTCVIKPDERTPLSALALAQTSIDANFPDGVLNFVTGDPEVIGKTLTNDSRVKKISFTGSTEIGKLLMCNSANQLKRITLELGGNAPFIVFADADIDKAVDGLIQAKFRNSGQTCVCANRVFIHAAIKESFLEKLIDKVTLLSVGNGMDDHDIGPLIEIKAIEKIERLVLDALSKGAKTITGGKRHALGGTFFEPTIIEAIDPSMDIFHEEIFGPVITLQSFASEEGVIKLANDTKYGLASYFYAKDHAQIWRVAEALEFGMVGVNRGAISSALVPFGGVKESGFGREGSKYGIADYMNMKYICISD